jgi:hypothetical protein
VRHVEDLLVVEAGMPPGLRDAARIEQLLSYRTYLRAGADAVLLPVSDHAEGATMIDGGEGGS